jgi:hypothetical protein
MIAFQREVIMDWQANHIAHVLCRLFADPVDRSYNRKGEDNNQISVG